MKVVLISSIVPGNTQGSNPVLYRHFMETPDIDLLVVSDGPVPGFNHVVIPHRLSSRLFKRIAKTSMYRWGNGGQEFFLPCAPGRVAQICQKFQPDVILTVAHGGFAKQALKQARSSNVPLVTIFHDWWPDLTETHSVMKPILDKQFRELHRSSKISLCVCEGMLAALGAHAGAQILYPIPSGSAPSNGNSSVPLSSSDGLKVIYMGNLGDYGNMVQAIGEVTLAHPRIRLEVSGRNPSWPKSFGEQLKARGQWHDFLPEDKLGIWLEAADVLLVTMRFEAHMRRFMETSFPSKIMHYTQFHKPIVIWGPEYCSAVRWARIKGSALCVTDPSPSALVHALETLSLPERAHWAAKATEAATDDFSPDKIQRQFLKTLQGVVSHRNGN